MKQNIMQFEEKLWMIELLLIFPLKGTTKCGCEHLIPEGEESRQRLSLYQVELVSQNQVENKRRRVTVRFVSTIWFGIGTGNLSRVPNLARQLVSLAREPGHGNESAGKEAAEVSLTNIRPTLIFL